jgi:hypothetical protein
MQSVQSDGVKGGIGCGWEIGKRYEKAKWLFDEVLITNNVKP